MKILKTISTLLFPKREITSPSTENQRQNFPTLRTGQKRLEVDDTWVIQTGGGHHSGKKLYV